jgi:cell division protein FtsZ
VLRTGTDNVPFHVPTITALASPAGATNALGGGASAPQPDYGSMTTPSVWRHHSRTQAAAKVDALSTGGMEDIEIPAFLRKQAD